MQATCTILRNRAFLPRSRCARSDMANKSCCLLKRKIILLNCFQQPGLLFWFLTKLAALEEIPVANCLLPSPSPCESSTREQHGTATAVSAAAARLLSCLLQDDAQHEHPTAFVGHSYDYQNFWPFFTPVDSNKLRHQGFAKEVSRYFFIAGLPVTRSVKSLCKSGNLLCGAVSIGKSSLATFCAWLCRCRLNISQLLFLQSTLKIFVTDCFCSKSTGAEQAVQHSMPACL